MEQHKFTEDQETDFKDMALELIGYCSCDKMYRLRWLTAPDCLWCNYSDDLIMAFRKAYLMSSKQQWIPVSERLPEKNCNVLVLGSYTRDCPRKSQEAIFFYKPNPKHCEFRNMDMSRTKNVTHWQPLPEKP